ncbi:MAG TPA: molybdate ABC transporter substrate-binding protein [Devosiaceae bacterium]
MNRRLATLFAAVLALLPAAAFGTEVHVAVAANFSAAATEIAAAFEKQTGDRAILSFGSTGQLFTQIVQGAPFEVFLAADLARPQKAIDTGLAVKGSLITYAVGRLVLFSADPGRVTGPQSLADPLPDRIAIANPLTAPYGAAAIQTLDALGLKAKLQDRLVVGQSIAQAFQFTVTGNAEMGFVAGSELLEAQGGSHWVVPEDLHAPIAQGAVLLEAGKDNAASTAFLNFLDSDGARTIIARYGYGTGVR